MIRLLMYGEDYEQDIRPLLKSFFPEEVLVVNKSKVTRDDIAVIDNDEQVNDVADHEKLDDKKLDGEKLDHEKLDDKKLDHEKLDFEKQNHWIKLYLLENYFEIEMVYQNQAFPKVVEEHLDSANRRQYRNTLHRVLYVLLSKVTKRTLPWGTLTGIRPTKQVLERLEIHESVEEIRRFMKEEYYCSEEKIDVSMQVAKRELEILNELDYKNSYSIYIGIPFCPSTCHYCSFTSYPLSRYEQEVESYLKALSKEIAYAKTCFPNKKLSTIYVGGGTPTTLSAKQLNYLLETIRHQFDISDLVELTVEAGRPDSITKEKLKVLKDYAVDRISINPQTMNQKTLDLIGRKHSVEQIEEAFTMARELGHNNINMDIIIGLSGETPKDVAYTLERIHKLNPDSLTVHTLAVKRAARLNTSKELYEDYKAKDPVEMLRLTSEYAKENGYLPYYLYRQKNMAENLENIGYAKYGKEGIYNILIMEEKQTILALGAGGSSKFVFHNENRIERVENVKSLMDYNERTDEMIERKKEFLHYNHLYL